MADLISLETAKAHLRVGDSDHDDALIADQLKAAIEIASDFTNRDLATEFTAETLPGAIKVAILMMLGTIYDNESDELVGRSVSRLSLSAERLLMLHRKSPYKDV